LIDAAPKSAPWDAARVESALADCRFGRSIVFLGSVDSTNEEVWRRQQQGAGEGLAVIADQQTAGRGRGRNTWFAPPGVGIWVSYLLVPGLPSQKLSVITQAAGVAAVRAADAMGVQVGLKWPNDLVSLDGTGRKIGGVLAESRSDAERIFVLIGIGINVNNLAKDFPDELRPRAASLRLLAGRVISREELLVSLTQNLSRAYKELETGREKQLLDYWRERAAIWGKIVRVRGGAVEVSGMARDISPDGALVVRLESGAELEVRAGDLEVIWEESVSHG
jgi:BirA family biotin operon repressor/biotin-[acetyl-CoA-carboxylase] ligase